MIFKSHGISQSMVECHMSLQHHSSLQQPIECRHFSEPLLRHPDNSSKCRRCLRPKRIFPALEPAHRTSLEAPGYIRSFGSSEETKTVTVEWELHQQSG